MSHNSKPIQRHPDNPRYFLYNGRPLALVTATEHYGAVINRNFDYVTYLDDAAEKQITLSRCFLLFRELETFTPASGIDNPLFGSPPALWPVNPHSPCKPLAGEYVAPFRRTGPGYATDGYPKFDLDQWNPEFFDRLHGFLTEARQREIIVELTLFSSTYMDPVWNLNPLNIRNNINGVGDIPWENYVSMRNRPLFDRQLAYARKIVREVNQYDNIYFEVCNEPFGDFPGRATVAEVEAWQAAVRRAILEEEADLPKQHMIFQCPVERNFKVPVAQRDTRLDPLVDEPTIDAITVHDYHSLIYQAEYLPALDRFMHGDLRLDRINHLWTTVRDVGKPVVFDEDNSASNMLNETGWTIHRKRAWTVLCSGGHYNMIDFSIQVGGGETGTPASQAMIRRWMKHLSAFIHSVDFISMTPVRGFAHIVPAGTIAVTLANPGREYVIYLADSREPGEEGAGERCEGSLAFSLPDGEYEARLYAPVTGQYADASLPLIGGRCEIDLPPFHHDVTIHIKASDSPNAK